MNRTFFVFFFFSLTFLKKTRVQRRGRGGENRKQGKKGDALRNRKALKRLPLHGPCLQRLPRLVFLFWNHISSDKRRHIIHFTYERHTPGQLHQVVIKACLTAKVSFKDGHCRLCVYIMDKSPRAHSVTCLSWLKHSSVMGKRGSKPLSLYVKRVMCELLLPYSRFVAPNANPIAD
ncbi:hypothetical protein VNO77_37851 [Canavalia gladiata]|uniref:Secreted protein n=1 Tax=Canavalia gladiata TaxID=3824 RepID=A0AAN9PYN6_CANGL